MKAIEYTKYGSPDVLELKEVEKPIPQENEVLIKVHAASINPYDWHFMRGKPYFMRLMGAGVLKPKVKILGADLAGKVEALGDDTKKFQVGDEVFGINKLGAFSEYVCVGEDRLAIKPQLTSFEEAASVPMAALTALQGLRDAGQIQPNQKVLVNGAGGGIGTFAVQIAKSFDAEVTGVCSTGKVDMVRSLGADHVVDYSQEDFTKSMQCYDLILDTAAHRSIFGYKGALSPKGRYVMVGGSKFLSKMLQLAWLSITRKKGGKKMSMMMTKVKQEDLDFLKELLESGKMKTVIDKCYPLSETGEAIRYLEEGHARGKIIITMEHNN